MEDKKEGVAYEQFHKVWGLSKDGKYDKKEWQKLYEQLMKLIDKSPFKL